MRAGDLHLHDAQALAGFAQGIEVCAEAAHVIFPRQRGIEEDIAARLEVFEARGRVKIEIQLRGIEHLKNDDFVAAGREERATRWRDWPAARTNR